MIEMNMHCGENVVMGFVLHVRQLVAEHPDVMVINQGDGPNDQLVRRLGGFSN